MTSRSESRSNDNMPDLGGDTPLESCKREARRAGYTASSWATSFRETPRCSGAAWRHRASVRCLAGTARAIWSTASKAPAYAEAGR